MASTYAMPITRFRWSSCTSLGSNPDRTTPRGLQTPGSNQALAYVCGRLQAMQKQVDAGGDGLKSIEVTAGGTDLRRPQTPALR